MRTSRGISCLECYESLIQRRPKKRGVLKNRPPKLELDGIDKDLPPLPAPPPRLPGDLIPKMRSYPRNYLVHSSQGHRGLGQSLFDFFLGDAGLHAIDDKN